MALSVQNTFLTIIDDEVDSGRVRSSSVPRAFKPNPNWSCGNAPLSDDSTNASDNASDNTSDNASDKDTTDHFQACYSDSEFSEEFADCRTDHSEMPTANDKSRRCWSDIEFSGEFADCRTDHSEMPTATDKSRVTLSLDDMVSTEPKVRCKLTTKAQPFKPLQVRCKLTTKAQPFKPSGAPPAEVQAVIENARAVLSSGKDIVNVRVNDGGMGGTTVITGESSSTDPDASRTLALVKDALLNSASQSENTYILGYDAQPFNNLGPLSFSASIACVPTAHQGTECWDTYQQGFCPRCTTCRWNHPSEYDKMRLIVMIKQTSSTCLD